MGSGKSMALVQEAIFLAFENEGRTGLVGAPTFPMLRDATLPALLGALDRAKIDYELRQAEMILRFPLCGSQILLRSLDAPERLRGPNLAWFGVDELTYCSEDAWMRLEARLRDPLAKKLCGYGVWTPKGFDWVYRRFRADPVAGYGLIEAQPFENRFLLKSTPDYYERLKASYDEAFYEQEVLGKYRNLQAGQVYCAFDRQENLRQREVDPDADLLWSLDFNVHPMCSVIAQREGTDLYVVDEIRLGTSSTPEVCEEFSRRYKRHRGKIWIYGDASGRRRTTTSAYSDYELIRKHFRGDGRFEMLVERSNPAVRDRINLVNSRLCNAEGERRLFVAPKCRGLIEDFEQVTYKADSTAIDKDRNPERTHLSDALGYLLWQEYRAAGRAGERSERLF
ncbi:MAG: hypothetical protein H6509_10790 [Bryobacterales bacterium]|nr:hypothetical protein [Bryobacterales bacterium]